MSHAHDSIASKPALASPSVPVLTWGAACLFALAAGWLLVFPDVEGARSLIRVTARLSLALFLLTFVASACWQRWPNAWSAALLSHRRQLGLLFAFSHACHAVGIACLALWATTDLWVQLTPAISRWVGGMGYVAVVAMAVTSWDGAVRWMGVARWRSLHRVGAHLIWLVFVLSCLKRVGTAPIYAVPLSLLMGAMVLRLWPAPRERASKHLAG